MIRSVKTKSKDCEKLINDLEIIIKEYNIEPTLYKLIKKNLNK